MMKTKHYAIIGELYNLRKIDKRLLLELSHSLEVAHSARITKYSNYFDLVDHVPNNYQLLMLNKIYDSSVLENRFFKGTESSFIIQVLRQIKIVKVSRGEFIYSANMPSNNGRIA